MKHPYSTQPARAFWRKTVESTHPLLIGEWYTRKFPIGDARIAAAGSCFAQHIGRELRQNGFNFNDVERPPQFLPQEKWLDYGYNMYSARYGNIYTSRQLLQLLQRAMGEIEHRPEHVWQKDGGFVDAFRPTIEAEPFFSVAELEAHRDYHLQAVLRLFKSTQIFVFTLGLTETWALKSDGTVFPVCPGTAGGEFDPDLHEFVNLTYPEIMQDMERFFAQVRRIRPDMKFILTVSPVPLMATATASNVISATSYSKSVLRAVAGALSDKYEWVDYFPSFEIISSVPMRSQFYNSDMRTVASVGVDHVMKQFFREHPPIAANAEVSDVPAQVATGSRDEVKCDEELLAAFGDGR
ncbi:GSCFA domain-containing protein [Asticcacaulis sp.]|uniref:GSCFA domain-containing protein n=1 Tax=Asticcacaulis sp. TaxID=1872648 RepID=UPI003F7C694F